MQKRKFNVGEVKANSMAVLAFEESTFSMMLENAINNAMGGSPQIECIGFPNGYDTQESLKPGIEFDNLFDTYLLEDESGDNEHTEDDGYCENSCVGIEDGVDILCGIEMMDRIALALTIIASAINKISSIDVESDGVDLVAAKKIILKLKRDCLNKIDSL